jgi:hypothetical protein
MAVATSVERSSYQEDEERKQTPQASRWYYPSDRKTVIVSYPCIIVKGDNLTTIELFWPL